MTIENIFSDNGIVVESINGGTIYVDVIYGSGGSGSADWGGIGGNLPDQSDLYTSLNDLQTQIDGKQPSGAYASEFHGHAIADITDLQLTLNQKQATLQSGTNIKTINGTSVLGSGNIVVSGGSGLPSGGTDGQALFKVGSTDGVAEFADIAFPEVTIPDVTGLQTALDGKQASGSYAASSHGHIIGDVTGLQTALDGKVASNSAITGATKAKITYDAKGLVTSGADLVEADIPTLSQSKVTNLTTDLAGKQATLSSGTNIKTINGSSILGSGDLTVSGGSGLPAGGTDGQVLTKVGSTDGVADWAAVAVPDVSLYIQEATPSAAAPYLWVELNPDTSVKTFWINI